MAGLNLWLIAREREFVQQEEVIDIPADCPRGLTDGRYGEALLIWEDLCRFWQFAHLDAFGRRLPCNPLDRDQGFAEMHRRSDGQSDRMRQE